MQAAAILLIASTMVGDFSTTPSEPFLNANPGPAPSAVGSPARDRFSQARQTPDYTTPGYSRSTTPTAPTGTTRAATTGSDAIDFGLPPTPLRLETTKPRIARTQYNESGIPNRPIDGMGGPGSRAASSDPTAAYGGRMDALSGYGSSFNSTAPSPTNRATSSGPTYIAPQRGGLRSGLQDNSPVTSPAYSAPGSASLGNTLPQHNNSPSFPNRGSGTETSGLARHEYSTNQMRNQGYNTSSTNRFSTASSATTDATTSGDNNGLLAENNSSTTFRPASATATPIGAPTTTSNSNTFTTGTRDYNSNDDLRSGGSYFTTLLVLFASAGLNIYLGWIAWDTYNRYQDLVADMRTTGSQRERRRERRRFTEPASSSGASY